MICHYLLFHAFVKCFNLFFFLIHGLSSRFKHVKLFMKYLCLPPVVTHFGSPRKKRENTKKLLNEKIKNKKNKKMKK